LVLPEKRNIKGGDFAKKKGSALKPWGKGGQRTPARRPRTRRDDVREEKEAESWLILRKKNERKKAPATAREDNKSGKIAGLCHIPIPGSENKIWGP